MPLIEKDIQYEYPKTEGERLALIGIHAKEGRMWVSSSRDGHPYRMKFCQLVYERQEIPDTVPPVQILPSRNTISKIEKRRKAAKARREKKQAVSKALVRYAGQED